MNENQRVPSPQAGLSDGPIYSDLPRSDLPPTSVPDGLREDMREEQLRPETVRSVRLTVDPARERTYKGFALVDPFDITDILDVYAPTRGNPHKGNIANEIDFNWKRYETFGRRDYAEHRQYQVQGWRPVMHEMFPDRFAPAGTTGPVIVKDMILMERPMRLTVQARNEEINEATRAMRVNRQKLRETPDGQAPRQVFTDRTTVEAIAIPE